MSPVVHVSSRSWLGGWRAIDITDSAEPFLSNAHLLGATSHLVIGPAFRRRPRSIDYDLVGSEIIPNAIASFLSGVKPSGIAANYSVEFLLSTPRCLAQLIGSKSSLESLNRSLCSESGY